MRVKDEETWLELSIRSLAPVADEILVGDNGSTDRTRDILEGLRQEWPDRLRLFHVPDLDIRDLTNFLIERTRFRWILRWDADFVARTEGPYAIRSLRETLLSLDPRRYCFAYLAMLELCGDLFHQRPGTATRADCHAFMYSDHLRYVYDPTGYEAPAIPCWYKVLRFELPTFFHLDVKPTRRMFLSFLWKRFLTDPEWRRYPGFEAYVETQLKQRWGGNSLEEAAGLWAASAFRELVPYDRERWGDYPTLLKPFLEQPTYRLLYQDGQIVGRVGPEYCSPSIQENTGEA